MNTTPLISSSRQNEDKINNNGRKPVPVMNADDFTPSPLTTYNAYRITEATEVTTPEPVVTINGETVASRESLVTFSGGSKAGKSALTAWVIALALADDVISDAPEGLRVRPANGKANIHIDTEQARHDHQSKLLSIMHRAGHDTCPDNLLSYNLRELAIKDYEAITTGICEAANDVCGGIHLIVIDGIADYIGNVNDEEQSTAVVRYFLTLATKYGAPVIAIVHTNPGSDKERGHLGSEMQRKSQSVVQVKKEGDVTLIEPKLMRNGGATPVMQLIYDRDKGYHVGIGIRSSEATNKDAERLAKVQECCTSVFAPPAAWKYEDAIERIMKHTGKQERTAKELFKDMKAHDWITQGEDKHWRISQVQ